MRNRRIRHSVVVGRCVLAAVAGCGLLSPAASAQPAPAFKANEPLAFTWHDTAQGPAPFVFQVFSADGTLTDLAATVINVTGPLGASDASSWRASTVPATASPRNGAQVIVAPPALAAAGEYQVTVLLTASQRGNAVEEARQFAVTRPAAKLAIDELQELTVRLTRAMPWSKGEGIVTAYVENDHPVTVSASLGGELVTEAERRIAAAGAVWATASDGGTSLDVPPGGRAEVRLALAGFDRAGKFKSGIVMRGPGLASPQRAAILVEVTDGPLLPFLTVLFGVIIGGWVQLTATRWRPQQENRLRIIRLRAAAQKLTQRISRNRDQVERLIERLARADEQNQLEGAAAAKAEIDAIQQELDSAVKAEDSRLTQLLDRLEALRPRKKSPADEETFAAAEADLRERQLDQADAKLRTLEALPAGPPGARPPEDAGPGLAASVRRRIDLAEPPDELVAGAKLSFLCHQLPGQAKQVEWDFGDGTELSEPRGQARHRFRAPGRYLVKASVLDADAHEIEKHVRWVAIQPSSADRDAALIRDQLRLQAWVTTAVSAVVASLTAVGAQYVGVAFGTPQQYLAAFLWGFGIDATVHQLSSVFKRTGSA